MNCLMALLRAVDGDNRTFNGSIYQVLPQPADQAGYPSLFPAFWQPAWLSGILKVRAITPMARTGSPATPPPLEPSRTSLPSFSLWPHCPVSVLAAAFQARKTLAARKPKRPLGALPA
jgi:hypothetical protein